MDGRNLSIISGLLYEAKKNQDVRYQNGRSRCVTMPKFLIYEQSMRLKLFPFSMRAWYTTTERSFLPTYMLLQISISTRLRCNVPSFTSQRSNLLPLFLVSCIIILALPRHHNSLLSLLHGWFTRFCNGEFPACRLMTDCTRCAFSCFSRSVTCSRVVIRDCSCRTKSTNPDRRRCTGSSSFSATDCSDPVSSS